MIKGFENITHDLKASEIELIPFFVDELQKHKGKANAITNSALCEAVLNTKLRSERVRKIINFIRLTGKVNLLCATSNGYFIAANIKEFSEYMEGLKDRIKSQEAVYNSLIEQYEIVTQSKSN